MQMWKNTNTDMWYFEIPLLNTEPTLKNTEKQIPTSNTDTDPPLTQTRFLMQSTAKKLELKMSYQT